MKKSSLVVAVIGLLLACATIVRSQVATNPYVAAGGSTVWSAAVTNSAQSITPSGVGGFIRSLRLGNSNASGVYYQFYNKASTNVTVGTTAAVFVIYVPPTNSVYWSDPNGLAVAGYLSVACTTTRGGSTAPAAACDGMGTYFL